jgi:hypothetical protein
LKSLEVSEEKANQRVEEFKRQLKSLTVKLKEAENRAELAEKTVKKLQKEVDRLEGMILGNDPRRFLYKFLLTFSFFNHQNEMKKKEYFKRQKKSGFYFNVSKTISTRRLCDEEEIVASFNCFSFIIILSFFVYLFYDYEKII